MGVTVRECRAETLAETLNAVRELLDSGRALAPRARTRAEAYSFIEETMRGFDYFRFGRAEKGLLRRYLGRATGLSRAQVTRLLKQYRDGGRLVDHRHEPGRRFSRRYTSADIELLAEVDALHGASSGPVTRTLCTRAYRLFRDLRFERLAGISNGHLYNLRRSTTYRRRRRVTPPPPTCPLAIGGRWRPLPFDRPGHLRVVSVSQGGADGFRGLYHLKLVDELTKFQFVGSVERLDAACLAPFLDAALQEMPFMIRGFHPDAAPKRGSREVTAFLQALYVDRVRLMFHGAGNATVESTSGAVGRLRLHGDRIPDRFAERVNGFTRQVLLPYLNYHRLCFFPTEAVDARGCVRKRYQDADVMTPYEKLKSLPGAVRYLMPGTTFAQLDAIAAGMSDSEAARGLNEAGIRLFRPH